MLERLDRFAQAAAAASDVAALRTLLAQEVTALGFARFSYMVLQRPKGVSGRVYLGTYPEDWARDYSKRGLWLHDPVMQYPFHTVQPFLWSEARRAAPDRTSEALVFGPAADVGLRAGAAVPIHGPDGGVALLAISKDCPEAAFQALFAEHRYMLQIVAYAAHAAVLRLVVQPQATRAITLSRRQREVLLWTIQGKTNWEIGGILHISQDTVRQHLRAICRLLGASNRAQAAAIAVSRTIVTPHGGSEQTLYLS